MRVSPGQCVHNAVGGGANANHHSRAVNHRLLGTIWGQTKLGFTLGGHLVVVPRHGVVWAREGGGGAAAERQLHDAAHQATSKLVSEPSSLPAGCLHVLPPSKYTLLV